MAKLLSGSSTEGEDPFVTRARNELENNLRDEDHYLIAQKQLIFDKITKDFSCETGKY